MIWFRSARYNVVGCGSVEVVVLLLLVRRLFNLGRNDLRYLRAPLPPVRL